LRPNRQPHGPERPLLGHPIQFPLNSIKNGPTSSVSHRRAPPSDSSLHPRHLPPNYQSIQTENLPPDHIHSPHAPTRTFQRCSSLRRAPWAGPPHSLRCFPCSSSGCPPTEEGRASAERWGINERVPDRVGMHTLLHPWQACAGVLQVWTRYPLRVFILHCTHTRTHTHTHTNSHTHAHTVYQANTNHMQTAHLVCCALLQALQGLEAMALAANLFSAADALQRGQHWHGGGGAGLAKGGHAAPHEQPAWPGIWGMCVRVCMHFSVHMRVCLCACVRACVCRHFWRCCHIKVWSLSQMLLGNERGSRGHAPGTLLPGGPTSPFPTIRHGCVERGLCCL